MQWLTQESRGLHCFFVSLGSKWKSHLETKCKLERCQLFLLHVLQTMALGKRHSMKASHHAGYWVQNPAVKRGLGFLQHGGLGTDNGSPLHFLPGFQLGRCLDLKPVLSPAVKAEGFCRGCAGRENPRGVPVLQLPCCLERETSCSRRLLCMIFLPLWEAESYPRGPGGSMQAALPARLGSSSSNTLARLQSLPPALWSLCWIGTFSLPFFPTQIFLLS